MSADAGINAACPRCGGGFHCGAGDARCDCFDLKLGPELREKLKAAYGGQECLCVACLVEIKAGAPLKKEVSP